MMIKLIAIFGGIFLFLLLEYFFKINVGRIYHILAFLVSCVPIIGMIVMFIMFIAALFVHQTDRFDTNEEVQVRSTKLNRWLFNHINWNNYDKYNKV